MAVHLRFNSWYIFAVLYTITTSNDQILRILENVNQHGQFLKCLFRILTMSCIFRGSVSRWVVIDKLNEGLT